MTTLAKKQRLDECVKGITDALPEFLRTRAVIGAHLVTIVDERLYLLTHPTWHEFVEQTFNFSLRTAQRFIAEYRPAEPAQITSDHQPTPEASKPALQDRQPGEDEAGPGQPAPLKDALGADVPARLKDAFATEIYRASQKTVNDIRKLLQTSHLWNPFVQIERIRTTAIELAEAIRISQPHAVHLACQGRGCQACRKTGFVTSWRMDEMKENGEWK